MFLEISQNSQENTCARVSFLIKLQASGLIKKEALAQVFSCFAKFCKISKNTSFTEQLRTIVGFVGSSLQYTIAAFHNIWEIFFLIWFFISICSKRHYHYGWIQFLKVTWFGWLKLLLTTWNVKYCCRIYWSKIIRLGEVLTKVTCFDRHRCKICKIQKFI